MLLERPGEVITRKELQARLWPADTYVGFDEGLNTAIRKLRVAFGDSAENPRFIETASRRGYRFIAPVEAVQIRTLSPPATTVAAKPDPFPSEPSGSVSPLLSSQSSPSWFSYDSRDSADHRWERSG